MWHVHRRLFTQSVWIRNKKLSFLDPKINVYGQWTESNDEEVNTAPVHPRPTPQDPYMLWTLDERRALHIYTRAMQVHRKTDPDWTFVGSRLDRPSLECKFISTYLLSSWQAHNNLSKSQLKTTDAGISATDLLTNINAINVNDGTRAWLKRLTDPPEQALLKPQVAKFRHWTEEMDNELLLECTLQAKCSKNIMAAYCQTSGRSLRSVAQRVETLRRKHITALKPLDEDELKVIADASVTRYPQPVRWKHVCEKLPNRSFFEVSNQIRHTL
ncbi:hypothetical protein GGH18_001978 [Coemansia sp. RSA 530]|nr:hypothetical protein GGF45_003891 [Coemansia sp. RSA 551]KAJ2195227.1 hypothetical protein GGH18_001978 [Coemansia sp. RSA 530]